jgi:hypothetical protein
MKDKIMNLPDFIYELQARNRNLYCYDVRILSTRPGGFYNVIIVDAVSSTVSEKYNKNKSIDEYLLKPEDLKL